MALIEEAPADAVSLPPVVRNPFRDTGGIIKNLSKDRGFDAWAYLVSGFILELLVWYIASSSAVIGFLMRYNL